MSPNSPRSLRETDLDQGTAFIIDADKQSQTEVCGWLSRLGYRVCSCSTLAAFRSYLATESPTLVVFDVELGGIDGLAVIDYLADSCPAAALLLLTSVANDVAYSVRHLALAKRVNLLPTLRKGTSFEAFAGLIDTHSASRAQLPAIDLTDVSVAYQPIINIQQGTLHGAEALIRFNGQPPSAEQIKALEIGPYRYALWERVIDIALRDWRLWPNNDLQLSVNIAAGVMEHPRFFADLQQRLRQFEILPQQLTIELTERAGIWDPMGLLLAMCKLRLLKINVSLDDFGSGYSTAERLRSLPFTQVKFDGTLMNSSPEAQKRLSQAVTLAAGLELPAIAELIEQESQLHRVKALGVELAQGYGIGRPDTFHALRKHVA